MVKKISTLVLLLVSIVVVFSSCTKGAVVSSQEDVAGTWAVTGIRSDRPNDWNGDGYEETDVYGSYSYCQRDIVLVLDDYGTGQARQGCDSYWQSLNWQLNNRTLHINLMDDVIDLNNLRVNYNTMQGDDYIYSNGRNYTITYTLQRR